MATDRERRDQAKAAASAGRFPEAIEIYRSLWTGTGEKDLWDARGLASALRKSGDVASALEVGREAIAIDPSFDPVLSELSWAIWQSAIKGATARVSDRVVEELIRLRESAKDPYSQYAAFTRSILDIAKMDLEKNDAERVLRLTEVLEPGRLDGGTNRYDGKTLPGERQRLFTLRGKALKALQRWPELERFGTMVAEDGTIEWANKGDIWIARWRIEAIFEQNRVEEALELAKSLLKRLDEWYVHADLAMYLSRLARNDEALVEAIKAVDAPGPFEYKVNAFKLSASLLADTGRPELAGPFIQATLSIRDDQGWPPDQEAMAICDRVGWAPSGADVRRAQHDVGDAIAALAAELDPPMRGEVTKILPEGRSGFITDERGEGRYFSARDLRFKPERLNEGLRVTFRATTSYDKKKDRETLAAADIRIDGG